ncbi:MAG TPA: hypothetical protein VNE39_21435 [Planctomycetota bacterium]|nr:hypothetical protein [Planctomycetota bacterium]
MNGRRCALVVCVVLAAVAGCARPWLTNRYWAALSMRAWTKDPHATVSVFVCEPEAPGGASPVLLALSPAGQEALIKAIAVNCQKPADLLAALSQPPSSERPGATEIDRTIIKKRLVFSVGKKLFLRPANRLDQLELTVKLPNDAADFRSWNKFQTEYKTVEIGKLTADSSDEISALLKGSGEGGSGEAKYTGKRSLKEDVTLRQQYVQLSGALQPRELKIVQEGVAEIDLMGNSTVDLTLALRREEHPIMVVRFGTLKRGDGRYTDPKDVSYERLPLFIPCLPPAKAEVQGQPQRHDVKASVEGRYRIRKVFWGGYSTVEGDDCVLFLHGTVGAPPDGATLVHQEEIKALRATWQIADSFMEDSQKLKVGIGEMEFATFQSAAAFLQWVQSVDIHPDIHVKVGSETLYLGKNPLSKDEVDKLAVIAHVR